MKDKDGRVTEEPGSFRKRCCQRKRWHQGRQRCDIETIVRRVPPFPLTQGSLSELLPDTKRVEDARHAKRAEVGT